MKPTILILPSSTGLQHTQRAKFSCVTQMVRAPGIGALACMRRPPLGHHRAQRSLLDVGSPAGELA